MAALILWQFSFNDKKHRTVYVHRHSFVLQKKSQQKGPKEVHLEYKESQKSSENGKLLFFNLFSIF